MISSIYLHTDVSILRQVKLGCQTERPSEMLCKCVYIYIYISPYHGFLNEVPYQPLGKGLLKRPGHGGSQKPSASRTCRAMAKTPC